MTPPVGLAPKGNGQTGRAVVGLAPKGAGSTGRAVVGLAPKGGAPKKGGGGFWHSVEKYSGAELAGNLAKDVGKAAVSVGPGVYETGKHLALATKDQLTGHSAKGQQELNKIEKPIISQYKNYYGHDVAHHIYTHPLQPLLDALTVASVGAGAAAKAGELGNVPRLAKLSERADVVTRSPRKIATGKGPSHVDITSTKPLVKGREVLAGKVRAKKPEGVPLRPGGNIRVGGEVKRFGKQIQAQASQHALGRLNHYEPYHQATRSLKADEWTALHIRAMDVHPDDLAKLWKGTPAEKMLTPGVRRLVEAPSKRMLKAEPEARRLSEQGAALYRQKGLLKDETAANRPALTKQQAGQVLGRPVKEITGKPYYFPHTLEPPRNVSPLAASGGGKAVPRKLGSTKQNTGTLALKGKLHLRSDVLGPEFLRRVKFVKYDEIHNALVRGAIRVSHQDIEERFGGKLPPGYEYIRTKPSTRIPPTIRGEGETHVPIEKLVPNPEELHSSPLGEGFTTKDAAQAHESGGRYYLVPKSTAKAATGEFTKTGDFTRAFVSRPLKVWRAAVLGLRVGFLTNNLVGNSLMYAVKTGGQGALRDLFGAIKESHGPQVAREILDDPATPPKLRQDLYKEHFPEQVGGTFGRTQSPSTSVMHTAGQAGAEGYRKATGALPKLTSKVAEEYPRRALVRHYIRHSPEFKRVYRQLPRQTRSFETAARKVLEGEGGKAYQRMISRHVNAALGDYLHLSPTERNVLRNLLPFYSWYKAITTTSYHLAVDTPLRANILAQVARIGADVKTSGPVPSYLQGSIPLGQGQNGTERVLATQGLNPYATLEQLGRGTAQDYTALGLNPFIEGPLQYTARARGNVSPLALAFSPLKDLVTNLPPSRLIAPPGPSKLYPTRRGRGLKGQLPGYLGAPIKEFNPTVAAQQAAQGR